MAWGREPYQPCGLLCTNAAFPGLRKLVAMAKLIYSAIASLDGYVNDAHGVVALQLQLQLRRYREDRQTRGGVNGAECGCDGVSTGLQGAAYAAIVGPLIFGVAIRATLSRRHAGGPTATRAVNAPRAAQ